MSATVSFSIAVAFTVKRALDCSTLNATSAFAASFPSWRTSATSSSSRANSLSKASWIWLSVRMAHLLSRPVAPHVELAGLKTEPAPTALVVGSASVFALHGHSSPPTDAARRTYLSSESPDHDESAAAFCNEGSRRERVDADTPLAAATSLALIPRDSHTTWRCSMNFSVSNALMSLILAPY